MTVHKGAEPQNGGDVRVDPFTGTTVHVVHDRQDRPNLPASGCPFCVGGIEAPEPYDVKSFPNRWPAMTGDRCEVVLYTSDHDATFGALGADGVRRVVDLWAERSVALGTRDDVAYVLVFENRGESVGATISHPHGQIYAYDHVPERPRRRLEAGWRPDLASDERAVARAGTWSAWVPWAPIFPIEVTLAPDDQVPGLSNLDDSRRAELSALLVDVLSRLDRLFGRPLPYMLWINQRPFTDGFERAWLNIEIVSPWRSAELPRFIAAAELAGNEFFNPVVPEDLAASLRDLA